VRVFVESFHGQKIRWRRFWLPWRVLYSLTLNNNLCNLYIILKYFSVRYAVCTFFVHEYLFIHQFFCCLGGN
jgi:hypothetical protein